MKSLLTSALLLLSVGFTTGCCNPCGSPCRSFSMCSPCQSMPTCGAVSAGGCDSCGSGGFSGGPIPTTMNPSMGPVEYSEGFSSMGTHGPSLGTFPPTSPGVTQPLPPPLPSGIHESHSHTLPVSTSLPGSVAPMSYQTFQNYQPAIMMPGRPHGSCASCNH